MYEKMPWLKFTVTFPIPSIIRRITMYEALMNSVEKNGRHRL